MDLPCSRRTALAAACALAASCGGSHGATDTSTETDATDDECTAAGACTPFAWTCDDDGNPVECSQAGDVWIPRDPCPAGRSCDPATGWCECPACELPVAGECERVGPACEPGWVDDGECGCTPARDDCPEGTIAPAGGGCIEVGAADDCGVGTWGSIPIDSTTLHVDGSYAGTSSDGSALAPFTTIGDAVLAVPGGATAPVTIAIAAGVYAEAVTTDRPVSIAGRCPSMVTISPPPGSLAGVWLRGQASSARSLTIEGGYGMRFGLALTERAGMSVENVVIREATSVGLLCEGCEATVSHVTIEDTGGPAYSGVGDGVEVHPATAVPSCGFDMSRSTVTASYRDGIKVNDCRVTIAESLVEGAGFAGMEAQATQDPTSVTLTGNVIDAVRGCGVLMPGSTGPGSWGEIEVSLNHVTGTLYNPALEGGAQGGLLIGGPMRGALISQNHVEESEARGLLAVSVTASSVTGNRIERTGDRGIQVSSSWDVTVSGNTVLDSTEYGIFSADNDGISIERNSIRRVELGGDPPSSRGIGLQAGSGESVLDNSIADAEWGIPILFVRGLVDIERNLVDPGLLGVSVQDMEGDCTVDAIENRVTGGAIGIQVMDSPCRVTVARNALGPIDGDYELPGHDAPAQQGIILEAVSSSSVTDNLVAMLTTGFWSNGIWMYETPGTVSGCRVTGAATTGIWITGTDDSSAQVLDNTVVDSGGVGIFVNTWHPGVQVLVSGNVVSHADSLPWPDGFVFGDGLAVVGAASSSLASVQGNLLAGCERTGVFVSESTVTLEGNDIHANEISMAWQDGAAVTLLENDVRCNGSDQPSVDQGMSVPFTPDTSMPMGG